VKSIRKYLYSRILWGSSVILVIGSVLLALAIRHLDIKEYDADLESKARTLATLVLREGREIEVNFAGEFMPEFETAENPEYFQVRLQDGSLIERSDMLGERDLPFFPDASGMPVFQDLQLPDGRRGRFVQIGFPPRLSGPEEGIQNEGRFQISEPNDPDFTFVVLGVARSRAELDALLMKVYFTLAGVDALLIGLIALLVYQAMGKGFRPLADLNAQIACLGPDTLERRIHLADAPAEIAALPAAVNSFLEVLQASFARERRFVGDVAHELRTPVAEFRAACEVGARWSEDPDLVRRRFRNLQESAVNMGRMLNGLLDLNQLDSGAVEARTIETRIAPIVESCWARVCSEGVESRHPFHNRIDPSLSLHTDPVKLEQIFFNLLENAASYSLSGSAVTCESNRSSNGSWEIFVASHPNALEIEDIDHIFERFWRKDSARTGGRHSGLGLSIVKALADTLGIKVSADLTIDRVFTLYLRFPSP